MSRKLLTLVLASCMLFALGSNALAQTGAAVSITNGPTFPDISGNGLDFQVGHASTYEYTVQFESDVNVTGATMGFIIYSPDGSLTNITWVTPPAIGVGVWGNNATWDFGGAKLTLGADAFSGSLPSTWLSGGVSSGAAGTGYGPIALSDGLKFSFTLPGIDGGILCIDSAFFPPSGEWLMSPAAATGWSGGGGDLSVGGSRDNALCVTAFVIPDQDPVCDAGNTTSESTNHCDALNFSITLTDPDPENQPITYSATTTGTGTVSVDGSGNVSYVPGAGENGSITITVNGAEPDGPNADCVVNVEVTNSTPALVCPPNIAVAKGNSGTSPAANGSDADACDALVYSLVSVAPVPVGTVSVDPTTGAVTFAADNSDAAGADTDYDITLSVTDGIETVECTMTITVLFTEPFCVSIDQTDKTDPLGGSLQGHQVEVCLNYDGGSNELGGFDFLISYDNSALSFVGATEGNIFADYAWEYFTYRFGPNGNCTGGCPSGKLRVIGLAEQNDGMAHPNNNLLVVGDDFACLTFLVSNDRNLECQFAAIRWCWIDCGDNSLSSSGGDTLYVSRNVFDYIGTDMNNVVSGFRSNITGADQSFPTFTGAPDDCDVATPKGAPIRFVDYKNGGIRIICAEEIDARGDINLNGLSNEIADATMLTNYFVSGLSAFGTHIEGSIAASEVNGDGIPLTVADLVYLIRVIVGDALPLPKLAHNAEAISITSKSGVVSSSVEMGAALFVFEGEVDVTLLATNMDIEVGVVDGNTHALVFNVGSEVIAAGNVVSSEGTLVSVEAADYNGVALSPGLDVVIPTSFAVYQNYPNPFNPNTKITFDLPEAAKYSVRIYNVAGQLVRDITGEHEAGLVSIDVDLASQSTGIYFYKVSAAGGKYTATRKLALVK